MRGGTRAAAALAVLAVLLAAAAPAAGQPPPPAAAAQAAPANATDLHARARRVRKGGKLRIHGVKGLPSSASSLDLERFEPFAPGAKVVVKVRPECGRGLKLFLFNLPWQPAEGKRAVPPRCCSPYIWCVPGSTAKPAQCSLPGAAQHSLAVLGCPANHPRPASAPSSHSKHDPRSSAPSCRQPHTTRLPPPRPAPPCQADPNSPPLVRAPPNNTYFRGSVSGSPESTVMLVVDASGGMSGEVRSGKQRWRLHKGRPGAGNTTAAPSGRRELKATDAAAPASNATSNTTADALLAATPITAAPTVRTFKCGYDGSCTPKPYPVIDPNSELASNKTLMAEYGVGRGAPVPCDCCMLCRLPFASSCCLSSDMMFA